MKKLIMITIALLMIFGADGFRAITFPGNIISCEEAEAWYSVNETSGGYEVTEIYSAGDILNRN